MFSVLFTVTDLPLVSPLVLSRGDLEREMFVAAIPEVAASHRGLPAPMRKGGRVVAPASISFTRSRTDFLPDCEI